MCGIIGVFGETKEIDRGRFERARDTLTHRGPDDSGFFDDLHCLLGHRRLSIIDLSSGGHQPMHTHDNRYHVVFNGEIYNYKALRLQMSSYLFVTESDTEVLLALYQEYGKDMVDHLEGMFAFVIYDKEKKEIFAARDPMGVKPLVYGIKRGRIYLASEIKAIQSMWDGPLTLDRSSVYDFFCLKHIPAPNTIFHEIKKLPAGCTLSANLTNLSEPKIHKYWSPVYKPADNSAVPVTPREVRDVFLETVQSHLVADVPVGAFLSGGIDSSAIVWAMKECGIQPKTYTVGFDSQRDDPDLKFSRIVAKHFDTDHHEYIASTDDYWEVVKDIVTNLDEPFADPAIASNWYVAKETAKDAKVVLSGDGGDEVFFGYRAYHEMDSVVHRWFRQIISGQSPIEYYFGYKNKDIRSLLSIDNMAPRVQYSQTASTALSMRQFDLSHTLPEYYLRKTDLTSMMHSLEVRVPFCSRKFVEVMERVSYKEHMNVKGGKKLLKDAFRDILPNEIIDRPKHGFARPVHTLLTKERLDIVQSQLLPTGLFDSAMLSKILGDVVDGKGSHSMAWKLLVFATWYSSQHSL